jgi:hypothetical protein
MDWIREKTMREATASPTGTRCFCCGRVLRVYRRSLRQQTAKALRVLAERQDALDGDWVHAETLFGEMKETNLRGELAILDRFGFVHIPDDTERVGLYKVSPEGRSFLGGAPAPRCVWTYLGQTIRRDEKMVTISDIGKDETDDPQ